MYLKTIKYGVIGFSSSLFDEKTAYNYLDRIFSEIKVGNPDKIIEIVSGYTNIGISKIAYELAEKYEFVTVGFSAKQALHSQSGVYPVRKVILKGERFGDESIDFIDYINRLIRIGGGLQSKKETEMFKAKSHNQPLDSLLIECEVERY